MDRKSTIDRVGPYMQKLKDSIYHAWDDYHNNYAKISHIFHPRTRASLMRDHIIAKIVENFDKEEGVRVIERNNGLFLLVIKDLVLRFKKLDKKKRSSNIMTKQAECYAKQLIIPNFEFVTANLNAGYTPNETWTEIDGVFITKPDGNGISWHIDVCEHTKATNVVPFQDTNNAGQKKRRVTGKVHQLQMGIKNEEDGN